MVLYHWTRCSTCRAAREQLAAGGLQVGERDFFDRPLSASELDDLAAGAGGIRNLASTASPSFRAQGRALEAWSDEELRAAMLEEPRLLRRPMLRRDDGTVLVGLPAISRTAPAT